MLHWLKARFSVPPRLSEAEPVEPPVIANAPGFQVNFIAANTAPEPTAGWRFHAKLYLWTPLAVLQWHGRFAAEDDAAAMEAVPEEFGTWVKEPAAPAGWEPQELEEDSDVGRVKPSSVLPFFKAFRAIAESGLETLDQARKFNRLHLLNPVWKPHVAALMRPSEIHPDGAPDLASVWFCPHLEAHVKGVGPKLAAALYQAGFMTPVQVLQAQDSELLKVPGINRGVLKRIRQA